MITCKNNISKLLLSGYLMQSQTLFYKQLFLFNSFKFSNIIQIICKQLYGLKDPIKSLVIFNKANSSYLGAISIFKKKIVLM